MGHTAGFQRWCREQSLDPKAPRSVVEWLQRADEPLLDEQPRRTYSEAAATPFALLPEPLRWEFLYAVQARDLTGRAAMVPADLRGTYVALRRSGWTTAVGQEGLGRAPRGDSTLTGQIVEWQRLIDDAHREWSGVDAREPRVIYLRDLDVRVGYKRVGPNAKMDLRGIEQDWIVEAIGRWARAAQRGLSAIINMGPSWDLAGEVLRVRGTPVRHLGREDMNAIVKAIRAKWPRAETQSRSIVSITKLLAFARGEPSLAEPWAHIPAGFSVDPATHRPVGGGTQSAPDADEPFRFVPQPIIDWVMDHLDLLNRRTPYATAEARAMIFVHERCGRRTVETMRLLDDCISYDSAGAPYLEWRRGKPPYTQGKRLPIHQETHDVIRDWQAIKREHGIASKWLFPSVAYNSADEPYHTTHLRNRVKELIGEIITHAPYDSAVEGADGNLIYFDLTSIDAYAFRHAFAQRLADATDADGRATTPPDVLQDYMGHESFNTTMAYYEVTARRRKKAMDAISPRRLNLRGEVVPVDRERDGFTRIAVTHGHCSEPQNVAAGGHGCMLEHACESCPFFLVDPMEREGMVDRRQNLRVKLERARVIASPEHMLAHYRARIADVSTIIDGIDQYVDNLPTGERDAMKQAMDSIAEVRRRATAPRFIHLRDLLTLGADRGE
ncbi:tyrosine-type recombinase/integrase [Cellulomonas sp. GbtcB1]|uniref:tyrosine-type recombinase/integrase n=1 Tax=Cellulomonas sp. GbtcB1 TaxID=2824746 RepID=UPI001C30F8F6|nr:tyrosine-type recombinase/integrase [Cellulomonas sp. GbtcB1]